MTLSWSEAGSAVSVLLRSWPSRGERCYCLRKIPRWEESASLIRKKGSTFPCLSTLLDGAAKGVVHI